MRRGGGRPGRRGSGGRPGSNPKRGPPLTFATDDASAVASARLASTGAPPPATGALGGSGGEGRGARIGEPQARSDPGPARMTAQAPRPRAPSWTGRNASAEPDTSGGGTDLGPGWRPIQSSGTSGPSPAPLPRRLQTSWCPPPPETGTSRCIHTLTRPRPHPPTCVPHSPETPPLIPYSLPAPHKPLRTFYPFPRVSELKKRLRVSRTPGPEVVVTDRTVKTFHEF